MAIGNASKLVPGFFFVVGIYFVTITAIAYLVGSAIERIIKKLLLDNGDLYKF